MNNWKQAAAESIVAVTAPVVAPPTTNDAVLAMQLRAALDSGKVAIRDESFARSLLDGFSRWESFTDRQRPHVERLIAGPQESPDAPLAAKLREVLEVLTVGDRGFARSLLEGFERYGQFTDRQRPYAEAMVERGIAALCRSQPEPASAAITEGGATPVATQPVASPRAYTGLAGMVNLDKFARFTVGDLQLSLKNDGSIIWVKWHQTIAGYIDVATGQYRPSRRYLTDAAQRECIAEMERIDADPLAAARSNGILTGRCSCCGRPLTDPVSINYGIGPVCRSRGWGLA